MACVLTVALSACISPKNLVALPMIGVATYQGAKSVIGKKMSKAKDSVGVDSLTRTPLTEEMK